MTWDLSRKPNPCKDVGLKLEIILSPQNRIERNNKTIIYITQDDYLLTDMTRYKRYSRIKSLNKFISLNAFISNSVKTTYFLKAVIVFSQFSPAPKNKIID